MISLASLCEIIHVAAGGLAAGSNSYDFTASQMVEGADFIEIILISLSMIYDELSS